MRAIDLIQNSDFQIHAGWLIDGTGRPAQKNVLLHIENGYIRDILPITCHDMVLSATDLSECTVLPGLIDCHIHLGMSGTNDMSIRQRQLTASYRESREMMTIHAKELLKFGVMAARDGGDNNAYTLRYASECQGAVVLKVAGKAWHKPRRYGALIGRPPSDHQTLAEAILHESNGIHQVKIVQSGLNSLKHFGKQTEPQFSADELKAAVSAAKSLGLPVMVHSNGDMPTRIAIEAGCDSVEHGFFMGEENLKRMADKGIFGYPLPAP
ncbi:MAG: amidohydrolase family protein [Desulfobacteraceae bacterium]|nr:amidohydrolase family protein [Desulfobacteraceae bacterium]